ncbi:MAG: hypothetical protein QW409_02660 [Candidatus Aenigmatarchaeota archaeon]
MRRVFFVFLALFLVFSLSNFSYSSECAAYLLNSCEFSDRYECSSVSLVSESGLEYRRHYISDKDIAPISIAIDRYGNAWIGTKENEIVKINFDCKNNIDSDGDGKVSISEMNDIKDDKCIELRLKLPCKKINSVCIDFINDFLYAGCYDSKLFYRISLDGEILKSWKLDYGPFNCVVDDASNVWISTLSKNLIEINFESDKPEYYKVSDKTYSISKCKDKDCLIITSEESGKVLIFNTSSKKVTLERKISSYAISSISDDNFIYLLDSKEGKIYRLDFNLNILNNLDICKWPISVSIDSCNNVWIICSEELLILSKDFSKINKYSISSSRFFISDFTGYYSNANIRIEQKSLQKFRDNDGKCEIDKGENCATSPNDCSCGNGKICCINDPKKR